MVRAWGEKVSAQEWPLRSHLELGALPTAASCARLHAKHILREWRASALADTVELLVSEITSNAVRATEAVRHGRSAGPGGPHELPVVRFWLACDRRRALIQVWDGDPHCPLPQPTAHLAEGGRGLLLVEKLSAEWGCFPSADHGGKIVWALCVERHEPALGTGPLG